MNVFNLLYNLEKKERNVEVKENIQIYHVTVFTSVPRQSKKTWLENCFYGGSKRPVVSRRVAGTDVYVRVPKSEKVRGSMAHGPQGRTWT